MAIAFALLALLVLTVPFAAAQSALTIGSDHTELQVAPGATGSVLLFIKTTSTTPVNVHVSSGAVTGDLNVTLDPEDFTVRAGLQATVTATIRGPREGTFGVTFTAQERTILGQDTGTPATLRLPVKIVAPATNATNGTNATTGGSGSPPANATSPTQNGTSDATNSTGNATTDRSPPPPSNSTEPAWSVDLGPIAIEAQPGERAPFTLAVRNDGIRAATTNVTLSLPVGWDGALDSSVLDVPPNGTAYVRGTVTPRAGAADGIGALRISDATRAVEVRLQLRALAPPPAQDPPPTVSDPANEVLASTAQEDDPATSTPEPKPTIRVEPAEISIAPGASAILTIRLDNPTGAPMTTALEIAIVGLVVEDAPSTIAAQAGGSATATITVGVPSDAVVGATHIGEVSSSIAEPAEFRVLVGAAAAPIQPASIEAGRDLRLGLAIGAAGLGATTLFGAAAWRKWRWTDLRISRRLAALRPGLGLFALYARLAPRRALEHPRREAMLALLRQEPGLPFADVQRRLAMSNGVARHHLALLESAGMVKSSQDGALRRLWPVGVAVPVVSAPSLGERALALVLERGEMRAADLADALGVSRQSLHYHLKRLEADGRLVARREGGELVLVAAAS